MCSFRNTHHKTDLQRLVIQEAAVQGEAINTIEDMIAETSSAADAALRDYQAGMHSDAGKYNTRMTGMGAVSGGFLGGISLSWLGAGIGTAELALSRGEASLAGVITR